MKYLILFAIFGYAAFTGVAFYRRMVFDHFYKLAAKALILRQQAFNGEIFFSERVLKSVVRFLIKEHNPSAKRALLYLCFGKTSPAENYLKKHNKIFEAEILNAFQNLSNAIPVIEKEVKKNPSRQEMTIELAAMYFCRGNLPKARLALENINPKKASRYVKAKYGYYQSFFNLANGDMLSASENCSRAIKLFNRERAYYEEAKACQQMGTVYRISCVEDVAQFMFDAALKLNEKLGNRAGCADVYGNLGMLMILQERFEEAAVYFENAEKINEEIRRNSALADIYNQQALMLLLQKEYKTAARKLSLVSKTSSDKKSLAFGQELLAHVYYEQKSYKKAVKAAKKAEELYKGSNLSAMLESMYLRALCLFELKQFSEAEKLLRKIITVSRKNESSFHPANAYNLLGLIFLQMKDLKRAKGLFLQSLSLEQKNDRLTGIATDYANISLIEYRCGNFDAAEKTLQTALEYAKAFGENELSKIIKERLNKLKIQLKQ